MSGICILSSANTRDKKNGPCIAGPIFKCCATYLAAFFLFAVERFALRPPRFLAVVFFTGFLLTLDFFTVLLRDLTAFFFVAVLALAMTSFPFNC